VVNTLTKGIGEPLFEVLLVWEDRRH
jgi:hypothetical protein